MVKPFKETVQDHKRFDAVAGAINFEDALPGFKDEKDLKGFIGWVLRGTPGFTSNIRPGLIPGSNRPSPTPEEPLQAFSFSGEEAFTVRRVVSRSTSFVNTVRTLQGSKYGKNKLSCQRTVIQLFS